ncbi:MAG: hypothetical protein H0U74_00005, partial [Bradymonadaceae bacterium]|nr:hypothetical protein [Lujinxingiaceae bacterium]
GGVPEELLVDNAAALVRVHDVAKGQVEFSSGFLDFCRHWGTRPWQPTPHENPVRPPLHFGNEKM